jgi:ABC-type lipoprotein release transport system permease subunit
VPRAELASLTRVRIPTVQIDGEPVQVRAMTAVKGRITAQLDEGRVAGPGEIVLGRAVAERLGVGLGDEVTVRGDSGRRRLEVVGIGPMAGLVDAPMLGEGASATAVDIDPIAPKDGATDSFTTYVASVAPGVSVDRVAARIERAGGDAPRVATLPAEFDRFEEVRWLPLLLVGFLGVVAVLSTVQSLLAAIRRRRRELGILRCLGLARRGVAAAIAVQAVLVTLLGAVIGVPVGLVVGTWVWRAVATQMGVLRTVDVPGALLAAGVAGALVVTLAVSWWPGRIAGRRPAAEVLRVE